MAKTKHQYEYKGYWLILAGPTTRHPFHLIAWNDRGAKQRRTRSTDTTDVEQALKKMIAWADTHPLNATNGGAEGEVTRMDVRGIMTEIAQDVQPLLRALEEKTQRAAEGDAVKDVEPLDDMLLKDCMTIYKLQRPDIVSSNRIDDSLADAIEVWGPKVRVKQLTIPAQHQFIANRRKLKDPETGKRRMTDNTILSRLGCIFAGISHCVNVAGILKAIPGKLPSNQWKPAGQFDARTVEIPFSDVVKYVRASFARRRWLRSSLFSSWTAARPDDVFHVQRKNYNREHGTLNLREWHPETNEWEPQNKKRCAIVKLCPTALKWMEYFEHEPRAEWEDPQYIRYQGRRLASFDYVHEIARRAGVKFTKNVGAYWWRHFMTQWCLANGCTEDDIKLLLGHKFATGATGNYAPAKPDYMARVAHAQELFMEALDAALPAGMSVLEPHGLEIEWVAEDGVAQPIPSEELEDQPEPPRYAAWLWNELQQHAMRLTPGRPVRHHDRGGIVAIDTQKDTVTQELATVTVDTDKEPGSD